MNHFESQHHQPRHHDTYLPIRNIHKNPTILFVLYVSALKSVMFAPWEHDAPSKLPHPLSSDTDTFSQYGSNEVSGMSSCNLFHLSGRTVLSLSVISQICNVHNTTTALPLHIQSDNLDALQNHFF